VPVTVQVRARAASGSEQQSEQERAADEAAGPGTAKTHSLSPLSTLAKRDLDPASSELDQEEHEYHSEKEVVSVGDEEHIQKGNLQVRPEATVSHPSHERRLASPTLLPATEKRSASPTLLPATEGTLLSHSAPERHKLPPSPPKRDFRPAPLAQPTEPSLPAPRSPQAPLPRGRALLHQAGDSPQRTAASSADSPARPKGLWARGPAGAGRAASAVSPVMLHRPQVTTSATQVRSGPVVTRASPSAPAGPVRGATNGAVHADAAAEGKDDAREEAYILSAFRSEDEELGAAGHQVNGEPVTQTNGRSLAPWEKAVAQASSAAQSIPEGRFMAPTPPTRSRCCSSDRAAVDAVDVEDLDIQDALPSTESLKATLQLLRWRARDRGGLSAPPGPPAGVASANADAEAVPFGSADSLAAAAALEAAAVELADAAAAAAATLT